MAQILVRKLDKDVVERLKKRAKKQGRSLEAEARIVLEQAVKLDTEFPARLDMAAAAKLAARIRARFKGRTFSDSADLIREDRDR